MKSISDILAEIAAVGPVLPGSINKYFTVCGKPGCRCADKKNPRKHGPYYRLSYTLRGADSSMFVKQEDAVAVEEMTRRYRKLRELTMELALATVHSVEEKGVSATTKTTGAAAPSGDKKHTLQQRLKKKNNVLIATQGKVRDISVSRDKWKTECIELKQKNRKLTQEIEACKKKIQTLKQAPKEGKKRYPRSLQ